MTVKKTQLAGLLLITVLLCSGCWDKKEYNQLALAQAIAIDYADGQYQLTMQLIMPKASEETVSSENIWIIDGQGDSVGDAAGANCFAGAAGNLSGPSGYCAVGRSFDAAGY